jgi:iron complex outermembrane receptor protein
MGSKSAVGNNVFGPTDTYRGSTMRTTIHLPKTKPAAREKQRKPNRNGSRKSRLGPSPAASAALALCLSISCGTAIAANSPVHDFADMSLEDLANIQVTSVSRKSESLADAPASIFVITNDDIHRSAATTLPEALRLAPNLQVARVDARNYAISARGFNGVFANKMLVLIDGRTVYSPLFSGTFWDAQDVMLEDVDRIEVISGPGATVWGANAVNGVINVITKSAADTQGTLLSAGAGSHEKNGAVRYGGELGNGGHYRVYGKYSDNNDTPTAKGTVLSDGWRREQAGFRTDWGSRANNGTLQGDAYSGRLHQAGTRDIQISGANIVGRISRQLSDDSSMRLNAYLDHTLRDQPNAYVDRLTTADFEGQNAFRFGERNTITWGGGYRAMFDRIENGPNFAFLPTSFNSHVANIFVQDEIELGKTLHLTVGEKVEHNAYTGRESLPSARLAWKFATNQLLWGAVSRAVRAPSRIDRDFFAPANGALFNGGAQFQSEVARVAELGYRGQLSPTVSFAATANYSQFDRLRSLEPTTNAAFPVAFRNGSQGNSRGLEMTGAWQVMPAWRLSAGLVAQHINTSANPGVVDVLPTVGAAFANTGADPSSYWTMRSSWDVSSSQEVDVSLRHVGALATGTPAYTSMDFRYGWKVRKDLEVSVIGQNLLSSSHVEFNTDAAGSRVERGAFLKLVWRL